MFVFFVIVSRALVGLVNGLRKPEYRALVIVMFLLLGGGTVFYHKVEGWPWLDSLYFCVVALLTVGFGDLAPSNPVSKIFTIAYLFMGVGLMATFVNLLVRKRKGNSIGASNLRFSQQDKEDTGESDQPP